MPMKVYGHPMSTCTRKVLATLAEKGHHADLVLVDLQKGEQKAPEHLARHPFGVIPVLDDDGFQLYESRAIIRYLDARLPGPALTPTDVRERGRMEQWISVEQSYFTPGAMKVIYHAFFFPMGGRQGDPAVIEAGRAEAGRVLDVVDKALADQPYLAGNAFSLAEISWLPYLQYLTQAKSEDLITNRQNVAAWWERISKRPAWQKVIGK